MEQRKNEGCLTREALDLKALVSRQGGSDGAAVLFYNTSDGTATAGEDYVAASGYVTWNHSDTADKVIEVRIIDDDEADAPARS